MKWGDIIGGAVKQGLQRVPSVLGQAKQAYQDFRTDLPTYKSMADLAVRKAVSPKIQTNRYEEATKNWKTDMEKAKGMTTKQLGEEDLKRDPWFWESSANKSGSAEMIPYREYPNDPELSSLKQATLGSMNLRPAMKKYLEMVPVQSAAGLGEEGASGKAMRGGFQYEYPQGGTWETNTYKNDQGSPGIVMDKETLGYPYAKEVLQHEYLHNAPRTKAAQAGMTKLLKSIPENSIFRDAALQYYRNGELPPNPEELFATLGDQLGQYALTLPEIQAYYNNIFSQPDEQIDQIGYSYEPWNLPTTPTENGVRGYGREVGGEKLKVPIKIVTKRR